jgi:H+/Cl- antiporter ClcA
METTGAFPMLLPTIVAVVGAATVTNWLGSPPLGHGLETSGRVA